MREGQKANPVPCLCCGAALGHCGGPAEDNGYLNNQPCGGIGFESHGHYGSTYFDPMRESLEIQIAICDDCLRAKADRTRFVEIERRWPVCTVVPEEGRHRQ